MKRPQDSEGNPFYHPCKKTCSGWKDGFNAGVENIPTLDWEFIWAEYEKEKWERLGIALKTGQNYVPVNVKLIQELVETQLRRGK